MKVDWIENACPGRWIDRRQHPFKDQAKRSMMSNPFLFLHTGIFATVPSGGGDPNLAELICAAVAARIAHPPSNMSPLDPNWWLQVFDNVPLRKTDAEADSLLDADTPTALATACLGSGVDNDAPGAQAALTAWIGALHTPPARLNCLAVTADASNHIHLSLALVDRSAGKIRRTDATIDAAKASVQQQLRSIFGGRAPLSNEPYFCSLTPQPHRL